MPRKRRVGRPRMRTVLTKQGYSVRARKYLGTECEVCSLTKALVIHHCDQNVRNNRLDNLQTLCKVCHDAHHHQARKEKKKIAGRAPMCDGSSEVI